MLDQWDPSNTSTVEPVDSLEQQFDERALSLLWICAGDTEAVSRALRHYLAAIEQLGVPCELVVVGNGLSFDAILQIQEDLQRSQIASTLVRLHRQSAESAALTAGFAETRGKTIAVLPARAHYDLKDLVPMLDALNEGLDYVSALREPRIDPPLARIRSKLYNWIVRNISGIPLRDINSGLWVVRRKVFETVPIYGDLHLFLPILAARQGYRVGEVPVAHLETWKSGSGLVIGNCIRRALDVLTLFFLIRFTHRPFRFFGGLGTGLLVSGGAITLVLGVQRLLGQALADRPMLVLGALLMVFGLQLFCFGLLGELILFCNDGPLREFHVKRLYQNRRDHQVELGSVPPSEGPEI